MIIEIRAKNCFAFENQVSFSLKADMRNKKFASNVYRKGNFNVLKTAGLYGANNTGKTCFIKCIREIKRILLNIRPIYLEENLFTGSKICELGVTFLCSGREFSYDFKYNTEKEEFPYEKFAEILKDKHGNRRKVVWIEKDFEKGEYFCNDEENLADMMKLVTKNNLLCYLLDTGEHLKEIRRILWEFADKIDVINMNIIPIENTIRMLKLINEKNHIRKRMLEFIKEADIYLENFRYDGSGKIISKFIESSKSKKFRREINISQQTDQFRLVSTYKGMDVPSIIFDSIGTKKITALASYLIEGLEKGRILVVDELDSSLHFKLTRAIVSMFNNELNRNAQMVFTVHDINLIDCKNLFRKEQIWFVDKNNEGIDMYSLAAFTAKTGVRDTTDNMEKYKKGMFGALPEPDFMNLLFGIRGGK